MDFEILLGRCGVQRQGGEALAVGLRRLRVQNTCSRPFI